MTRYSLCLLCLLLAACAKTSKTSMTSMTSPTAKPFDIHVYLAQMEADACPRFLRDTTDVKFVDYALVDIDGDGQQEVWVRDTVQQYQVVYAIVGDSIAMLADADVCCELQFYDGAVGFNGYYTPGRGVAGATIVRDSRPAENYFQEVCIDIFNDMETLDESYYINDEPSDEESCRQFCDKLGDQISIEPEWRPIGR